MIFLLIYTMRSPFKTLNYLIVFLNIMYIWAEIKLAVWLSKWPQFALWNVLIACVIQSNPELCRAVQDAQGHGWCMLIGPSAAITCTLEKMQHGFPNSQILKREKEEKKCFSFTLKLSRKAQVLLCMFVPSSVGKLPQYQPWREYIHVLYCKYNSWL